MPCPALYPILRYPNLLNTLPFTLPYPSLPYLYPTLYLTLPIPYPIPNLPYSTLYPSYPIPYPTLPFAILYPVPLYPTLLYRTLLYPTLPNLIPNSTQYPYTLPYYTVPYSTLPYPTLYPTLYPTYPLPYTPPLTLHPIYPVPYSTLYRACLTKPVAVELCCHATALIVFPLVGSCLSFCSFLRPSVAWNLHQSFRKFLKGCIYQQLHVLIRIHIWILVTLEGSQDPRAHAREKKRVFMPKAQGFHHVDL